MSINRPELAAALKRARERIRPEDAGLPAGPQRRVPGLRREEVALLAGISVDYVVRLEQARGPHPSAQVVGALARALRLDDDERRHVFALADVALPGPERVDVHVRPSVLRLLDRMGDLPVMVRSATGDVLAWNAMSAALQGDWSRVRPERRNQYRLRFLPEPGEPPVSPIGGSPEEKDALTRQMIGSLRAGAGRYPDDPDVQRLVHDLLTGSEEFRRYWDDADVGPIRTLTKTVVHPSLGPLRLDCDTLTLPDADQFVVVFSAAPGTPEAEALALLRVVGTQDLAPQETVVDTTADPVDDELGSASAR